MSKKMEAAPENKNKNPRGKRWVFTLFNYTEEDEKRITKMKDVEYLVYGKETCPSTGKQHLQGFIIFKKRKSFLTVGKYIKPFCFREIARGSNSENREYCTKEKNFIEVGECPQDAAVKGATATKRKWEEARTAAREGRFDDIPPDLWIRYRNSFKSEYTETLNKDVDTIMDAHLKDHFYWVYGPTGTGKSHLARSMAKQIDPKNQPYLKGCNKWWSGYTMQKVVLIEEMSPESGKFLAQYFKQWCDRWPFAAETKGGSFVNGIRPDYIIVTSNYSIQECFPNEQDYLPLQRRMCEFYKDSRESWITVPDPSDGTQILTPSPSLAPQLPALPSEEILIDSGEEDEPIIDESTNAVLRTAGQ